MWSKWVQKWATLDPLEGSPCSIIKKWQVFPTTIKLHYVYFIFFKLPTLSWKWQWKSSPRCQEVTNFSNFACHCILDAMTSLDYQPLLIDGQSQSLLHCFQTMIAFVCLYLLKLPTIFWRWPGQVLTKLSKRNRLFQQSLTTSIVYCSLMSWDTKSKKHTPWYVRDHFKTFYLSHNEFTHLIVIPLNSYCKRTKTQLVATPKH